MSTKLFTKKEYLDAVDEILYLANKAFDTHSSTEKYLSTDERKFSLLFEKGKVEFVMLFDTSNRYITSDFQELGYIKIPAFRDIELSNVKDITEAFWYFVSVRTK
ncbi:unknown [Clostridium sp. CAG:921]|nr:unknown [Clostridium sp. CAG:921]